MHFKPIKDSLSCTRLKPHFLQPVSVQYLPVFFYLDPASLTVHFHQHKTEVCKIIQDIFQLILYCPGQEPMGTRNSSDKNWV